MRWLGLILASVWLAHGLICKAFGAVPRHRRIVARVVGERLASLVLLAVAAAEIGLAVWIVSGRARWPCAAAQTTLLASMNYFELRYAPDLLLSPAAMACANVLFLAAGWYWAATGGA